MFTLTNNVSALSSPKTIDHPAHNDISNLASEAKKDFSQKNIETALEKYLAIERIQPSYLNNYNIAVCYFKLGHFKQALKRFSELHKINSSDELVEYNLALTLKSLKKTQAANSHFEYLAAAAESDIIATLSYQQIRTLLGDKPTKTTLTTDLSTPLWLSSISAGLGSDSNVFSVVDDIATTQSDTFKETFFSGGWASQRNFNDAWVINISLYQSRYATAEDYNVDVFNAAVKKYITLGNWRLNAQTSFAKTQLANSDYLTSMAVASQARYKFNKKNQTALTVKYQQSHEQQDIYQPFAGNKWQFSLKQVRTFGHQRLQARYQYSSDDKNDSIGENTFTSYSADRHDYRLGWQYNTPNWNAQVFARYRYSHYHDAHQLDSDTTVLREDELLSYGVTIGRALGSHWHIDMDIRNSESRSTIAQYDYDQLLGSMTVSWNL